jgi:hypothetical protein
MLGVQMGSAPPETTPRALPREDEQLPRGVASAPEVLPLLDRIGLQLTAPVVPTPADYVFFMAGMPIAPWIEPRPLAETWQAWLRHLRGIIEDQLPRDGQAGAAVPGAWERWSTRHVHAYRFRRVTSGLVWLQARLAECQDREYAEVHLVGHSAGGAAALALLASLRARLLPAPDIRVRSVLTLDAAVSGLAGRWTNMRTFLRHTAHTNLQSLGDWAREQGIALLTIANEHDLWSHPPLADIPYLGLPLSRPSTLRAHLDGSVHAELRDSPQIIQALWPSG